MIRVAILAAALATIVVCTGGAVAAGEPMADAGLDQTVTVETTVQLDGTGSSHPDGAITSYDWTIRTPDGRVIEPDCPDCERSEFTPTTVGRYAVNLTVTGPDGARSTDTLYVYVEDGGPDVELSGDQTPDPNQAVTYTASASSPDAELEEIAWAVEDEIVTVRSLDGSTDESELSLAFSETETYRVQVVVRDSNGRTAYDQLYVQPQSGSPSVSSWDEVEPTGCENSTYAARNAVECWGLEEPEQTPEEGDESDPFVPDTFEVRYETDGYESLPFASTAASDSRFVGTTREEVGLDGGENAPWRQSTLDRIFGETIDSGSTLLFGQEERTVTCEVDGGDDIPSRCQEKVAELEEDGRTENRYSGSETGAYSEYGLRGGERVRGDDPTELEKGQSVEVTIVIQPEEEGIVDKAIQRSEAAIEGVFGSNDDNEPKEDSTRSSGSDNTDSGRTYSQSTVSDGRSGLQSSTSLGSQTTSTSGDSTREETDSTNGSSNPTSRHDRGLVL